MKAAPAIVLLLALLAFGCSDELFAGLDEDTANEVVGALGEGGIDARKVEAGRGRFAVHVPTGTTLESIQILRVRGLPRAAQHAVPARSIVPSAAEEHLTLQRATAASLRESLLTIPGVVDARVNLSLPPTRTGREDASGPRASVVVRYTGTTSPVSEADVRRIVAGAIPRMDAAAVEVLLTPPAAAGPRTPKIVQVGPIAVHEQSADTALLSFTLLLGLSLSLGVTTMLGVRLGRRMRRRGG